LERDDEHEEDERKPDERCALVDLAGERAPADALDEREENVTAVERQDGNEIEERERHAHEREDPEVPRDAHPQCRSRGAADPDDRLEMLVRVRLEGPREPGEGAGGDRPEIGGCRTGGAPDRIRNWLGERLEAPDPVVILPGRRAWAERDKVAVARDGD